MYWRLLGVAHQILMPILVGMLCLSACQTPKPKPEPSFYYWRSIFRLTQTERTTLATHHIHKLYIKLFDVALDPVSGKAQPIALLQCPDTTIRNYRIVPVTFITNQTLIKIDSNAIPALARNITGLMASWQKANRLPIPTELQLDCDWTAATRNKYFYLITETRRQLDSSRTGVPPVARGLLMCYNMGNLPDPKADNSILSPADLSAYTTNLGSYPLPLDIAFPIFAWKVLFHDGKYAGLIKGLPTTRLAGAAAVKPIGHNRYRILRDTTMDGYDLLEGDIIRDEQSDLRDILTCADRISHRLKDPPANIILFNLDSANLEKYTHHELESIFNSCN